MSFLPTALAENFHFLRPLFLLGLIPAFVMFLLLRYLQGSSSNWTRAIDPALLPYLLDRKLAAAQSYPLYGLLALWVLGFTAMAGPTWQQIPVPVQEREDAVVLILDLSMSMYATDVRPDRITRARRKVMDLIEERRQEGETALVVYAGTAHAVTPLTDDVNTIGNLVPSLQPSIMPAPGSKPGAGVALALDLLSQSNLTRGHLVLLTDGIQQSDVVEINQLLSGGAHRLSVLGFGTEDGAPIPLGSQGFMRDANNAIVIPRLERGPLQRLASNNAGRYADAQVGNEDITFLLEANRLVENDNMVLAQDREFDSWDDTGPWLILLALPLAALAFRRGWLLGLVLGVGLSAPRPALAVEWQDLWVNKNSQGRAAFENESFEEAATYFEDQQWRAAANYRNGNFDAAVTELADLDTPEAHYNRGNALANLQQYEAAIEAYDRTLAAQPDNTDAQHNKELVQRLLEQQQQEQDQQQQQQGDQQNQEQQQDGQQQDQQEQGEQSQQDQQQNQQQQGEQDQSQEQQDQQNEDQEQQDQEGEEQDQERESDQEQQQDLQQADQPSNEQQQAMEQWLMRIPDDPGELLRNKFQYQTQQRLLQQLQNPALVQPQPGDPLW